MPPVRDRNQPSLGSLANDVVRLMNRTFDERVGHIGLTRAQWKALLHLTRREGMTQSELSEILEVRPPSLARLVDRLEASGWLERRADPQDRRTNRLYLTDRIEPTLKAVHRMASQIDGEALAGFTRAEAAELSRLLRKAKRNLAGVTPETRRRDTA